MFYITDRDESCIQKWIGEVDPKSRLDLLEAEADDIEIHRTDEENIVMETHSLKSNGENSSTDDTFVYKYFHDDQLAILLRI